jgi:hypothetical protein
VTVIITSKTRALANTPPTWPFAVDYSSPQAKGLRFCWPGIFPYTHDMVSGGAGVTLADGSIKRRGTFFAMPTGNFTFTTPAWLQVTDQPFSLLYKAYSDSIPGIDAGMITWQGGAYLNDVNSPDELRWRFPGANNMGSDNWATWTNGVEHSVAAAVTPANTRLYLDGTERLSDDGSPTSYTTPATGYIGAKNTTSNDAWNGYITDVRFYDHKVSAVIPSEHAKNGWSMYEGYGRRAYFMPAAAVGGGFQTAWAASSNTLISNGVVM